MSCSAREGLMSTKYYDVNFSFKLLCQVKKRIFLKYDLLLQSVCHLLLKDPLMVGIIVLQQGFLLKKAHTLI